MVASNPVNDSYLGHVNEQQESADEYLRIVAVVKQLTAEHAGAAVVRIVAVHSNGTGVVGTVDVLPQVHQIDGAGTVVPHDVIHGVPYSRVQGGASAVIMDPVVGDLGVCVFADRDLGTVKQTRQAGPPGSFRVKDMADGMYVGGLLNGPATQYVDFTGGQLKVVSTQKISLTAPEVDIASDQIKLIGASLTHNGVNVGSTHTHQAPNGATSGPR